MRFTVLGSGTTVPDVARGPAGFLLQVAERAWLVDGGSGTMQRCTRAGVDPRVVDGGFYTHRHIDHCGDLVPLLFAMHVGPPPRAVDYPIWAGTGFQAFFDALRPAYGHYLDPGLGQVRIHELSKTSPDGVSLGDLGVTSRPAAHGMGALHFRFEAEGHAVVFSGDTAMSEGLIALATGADLLVVECAGDDDAPVPGHLCPSEVAAIVDAARPAQVWLTHFYPHVDVDRAIATVARVGVPVRRAEDQDVWASRGD